MPLRVRTIASIAEHQAWSGERPAGPFEQHRQVQLGRLHTRGLGDGGVQLDRVGEGHTIGFEGHVLDGMSKGTMLPSGRSQLRNSERRDGGPSSWRRAPPFGEGELDDAVESIGGYRELHGRLVTDDLPRFEAEFQELLRTNAIRDIAGFYAELRKQAELIDERIDRINDSLHGIDYNHGRYISLETARTPNMEVRAFIADLRACTDSALEGDDADGTYSERKFHQVRALVERFRGRDGSTEVDRIWTQRVTDVRNWVVFTAVERWRDTDEEHETYTDSGGKSGGQKEKLAYTVLAASLAYQFKLSWGADRAKAFQMAVIDEAFGRGSDESTRYALALFRRLGLQLIVVTPLQKIHVIEHAVSAVGFVDNPTGAGSRMHTLTIQEYRAGRAAHLAAADQPAPDSGGAE